MEIEAFPAGSVLGIHCVRLHRGDERRVSHRLQWREPAVSGAGQPQKLEELFQGAGTAECPPSWHLLRKSLELCMVCQFLK